MENMKNQKREHVLRPFSFDYDFVTSVPASVLMKLGNTKVLVTVSLQKGVPPFLKNSGQGWLTAEYSMLPHATEMRSARNNINGQTNGRSVEISRLIGRVLRTVVDTDFGEQTLHVDCEVLQADGGTRAASIIAASIALERAEKILLEKKRIRKKFLKERVAAISIGIMNDHIVVDPSFQDDQLLQADFNVILTEKGDLIELHWGAEKAPVSWTVIETMKQIAFSNVKTIFELVDRATHAVVEQNIHDTEGLCNDYKKEHIDKTVGHIKPESQSFGIFSLKNRLEKSAV